MTRRATLRVARSTLSRASASAIVLCARATRSALAFSQSASRSVAVMVSSVERSTAVVIVDRAAYRSCRAAARVPGCLCDLDDVQQDERAEEAADADRQLARQSQAD